MRFEVLAGDATTPRAGLLDLPHGTIETPAFMPVGTRGTVKALDADDLRRLGPGMVLANAYHLWLAPGPEAVAAAGGLHAFTGWEGNLLTDSGGYQAVSLARRPAVPGASVSDAGVEFADPAGTRRLLTPEAAVEIQQALAPDVMMVLDQPLSYPAGAARAADAAARTHAWAARCQAAWSSPRSELFGIVQGGFDPTLRAQSARAVRALGFPGYGIGGLSLDEPPDLQRALTLAVTAELEPDKPRYLMGLGSQPELLAAVAAGCDLFDCVWPTRLARTGTALVGPGRLNLRRSALAGDPRPLEDGCGCAACQRHTRAQLHFLHLRGELLAHRLLTIHNLHHLLTLMRQARAAILAGTFEAFAAARLAGAGRPASRPDAGSVAAAEPPL
ncbi:MAG TPA: tRNA guanosine(34) transglycosylase Tgt [Candidatus Dormibacteraeota bacterium]|nr:tRNA guanosine(34) transglycosylase Tgt [Candidatus Dormibacteraeota bacterium]